MTYKNLIEEVQTQYPNMGTTQILQMLTDGMQDFAQKTRLCRGVWFLPSQDYNFETGNLILDFSKNYFYYNASQDLSVMSFTVPPDFIAAELVQFYTLDNREYDPKIIPWRVADNTLYFGDWSIQTMPEDVGYIKVTYYSRPAVSTGILDSPAIPDEFHRALLFYVYERLDARANPKLAEYNNAKWKDALRDGRRQATQHQDSGQGFAYNQEDFYPFERIA